MYADATKPGRGRLFDIAGSQDDYFTMAQALEAGFGRNTHSYHVKAGNWVREYRGIYRLVRFPVRRTGIWCFGHYGRGTATGNRREFIPTKPPCISAIYPMRTRRKSVCPCRRAFAVTA